MARRAVTLSIVAVVIAGWALLQVAERVGAQEDVMVLNDKDVFKDMQRPPVQFPHEKHAEIYSDCVQCHHVYEYKNGVRKNVWDGEGQKCSECHKAVRVDNRPSLRNAFHENCVGCHRKLIQEGKKSGPETCGECHVRSSGTAAAAHP